MLEGELGVEGGAQVLCQNCKLGLPMCTMCATFGVWALKVPALQHVWTPSCLRSNIPKCLSTQQGRGLMSNMLILDNFRIAIAHDLF